MKLENISGRFYREITPDEWNKTVNKILGLNHAIIMKYTGKEPIWYKDFVRIHFKRYDNREVKFTAKTTTDVQLEFHGVMLDILPGEFKRNAWDMLFFDKKKMPLVKKVGVDFQKVYKHGLILNMSAITKIEIVK